MIVEVTQEDIKNGHPGCAGSCPIALAIQRTMGQIAHVGRGLCAGPGWVADLPADAADFVRQFDNDGPVAPFAFELQPKQVQYDSEGTCD